MYHILPTLPFQIRSPPNQWKPSVTLSSGEQMVSDLSYDMRLPASQVLSIIQEKVNNPSPDDPFEPDIAAVNPYMRCLLILALIDLPSCSKPTRPSFWQLQKSGQRSKSCVLLLHCLVAYICELDMRSEYLNLY